ncbi:MAG: TonB-dependent receptor [Bacteroidota bacterium]|nr:TonB-dependent receptor [Bacteroidota bacterium]
MKKFFCLLTVTVLAGIQVFAQTGRPGGGSANMPADGKITGKVIDKVAHVAIGYASVGVYRMKDSSMVSGALTDTLGRFTLNNLPYGRFYAEVKFIGYKKSRVNGILVVPNQKTADLGNILVEPSSTTLKEVEVTGSRPPLEYKLDRKVVNVSQQIAAAGGTAVDVLENTPSVQTDVEGNVQLRGSSSFTVLIDGKPSVLKGSEALQQIPASTIQSIEIITNPSAKYDPDGSAGIINIIMKKEKISGINGVVNLSAGTGGKYNGDLLVNYKHDKVNYFFGADYSDLKFNMKNNLSKWTRSNDSLRYQLMNLNGDMHRTGKGVKAGFDFAPNDKNTISFSARYAERAFGRNTSANYYEYTNPAKSNTYYLQNNTSNSPHKFVNLNLDYLLRFDDKGHQLAASAYWSNGPSDSNTDMVKQTTDQNWTLDGTEPRQQHTSEKGEENEFRLKLDYTKPLGDKGKFEAGYQGRYESSGSKYHFENYQSGQWIEDMTQYNDLKYTDNIQSVYSTLSNSMKLFDYQLGIRGEYTDRKITQKVTGESYPVNRFDLFPTIHLSKQLPFDLQLLASYSRRINRPDDHQLDPLPRYIDDKNIRKGNPALAPEFADSYELSLQKRFGAAFLSVDGFYKKTNDLISQIVKLGANNIMEQTFANLNHDYSMGTEIMLNIPLSQAWNVNASTSIYHYKIDGSLSDSTVSNQTNTWNSRINTTLRFKWGMQLQANFFYNAKTVTAQGTRDGFFFTSLGLRQEVMKKKASLTLQVRDLFGNMKFVSTSQGPDFYIYNRMKRESPVFTLTFSYRINNFKQQMKKGGDDVNESDFNGGGM